jgi:hypothetical protein
MDVYSKAFHLLTVLEKKHKITGIPMQHLIQESVKSHPQKDKFVGIMMWMYLQGEEKIEKAGPSASDLGSRFLLILLSI